MIYALKAITRPHSSLMISTTPHRAMSLKFKDLGSRFLLLKVEICYSLILITMDTRILSLILSMLLIRPTVFCLLTLSAHKLILAEIHPTMCHF
jgi:hypothetical protein